MAVDLDQYKGAFFEESFEALDAMESALLRLDFGAPDAEQINTIFRVAHSIKGGSGMFGFKDIASFTHTLETLLDELRGGRMHVTPQISDLLLKSVDLLRQMMQDAQAGRTTDSQIVADLQFDLELLVVEAGKAAAVAAVAATPAVAAVVPAPERAARADVAVHTEATVTWLIRFEPLPGLLARGNDPLRMFGQLEELGELEIVADTSQVPTVNAVEPDHCVINWDLRLVTSAPREAIDETFEWAEGDCRITMRRDGDRSARTRDASADASTRVPESAGTPATAAQPPSSASLAAASTPSRSVSSSDASRANEHGDTNRQPPGADGGSIRVSIERIDELLNTVGEIVIAQSALIQVGYETEGPTGERLRQGLVQLERHVRELQESVMRVRMLPISFVFSRFPRMVRDLAKRLDKQIELRLNGESTELDKTVLEKIGDPMVHLVRNSIDHGIESPEARIAAGKPAAGTVTLDAYHKGGAIRIEVRDDGKGLDRSRILQKAQERGLVPAGAELTDEQIHELIFLPGFSTAEQTTDLSGRGVGMDVVRRNIAALGGRVTVRSAPGEGSCFEITLPLTLAILDGQTVQVGNETYIVPLLSILESLQVQRADVRRISGAGEVFRFRDEYVPIVRLHEYFGLQPRTRELHEGLVVVVEGEGRRVGLFVDELKDQQQVVIKSLESNYGRVQGISGATILGDGAVALILDVPGLIRAATARSAA